MRRYVSVVIKLGLLVVIISATLIQLPELPHTSNSWFSSSGVCVLCHSTSTYSMLDSQGNDVSPIARWRGTMLANASKDPFWRAKVKHEGIINPNHKEELENVCTRCHAPMGMLNAFLSTGNVYTLEKLVNDSIGLDGISCTLCHQVTDQFSSEFSGQLVINQLKQIYGPYEDPLVFQMLANSGYTPQYSEHINDSRLCGSCHSLFTNSVDENGKLTGETFVEQALYHEWENSIYSKTAVSCQSCHMPRIDDAVKISSRPGILAPRSPYGIHDFTGGNIFMLSLLKANHDRLELNSGEEFIQKSIERTHELLTKNTISLGLYITAECEDSVFFEVRIENKAGHKFPTGFPSRRAYLEFIVYNASDTLFHSGKPNAKALTNTDLKLFEPHYKIINEENQVQIYEFVMGDTRNNVTTVLERAYVPLKDNRIVPKGFSNGHRNYDTVRVVGNAENDADYFSGSGVERLIYALSKSKIITATDVRVIMHYETVPENWLKEMFSYATVDEDIDLFQSMYNRTGDKSVQVATANITYNTTHSRIPAEYSLKIYPNPTRGKIRILGLKETSNFEIYNLNGTLLKTGRFNAFDSEIDLGVPPGTYILNIATGQELQKHKIVVF